MRYSTLLILLLLCLNLGARAQQVLDKQVTLQYRDAKVKDILLGLEARYKVKFYYANNMVPLNTRVNVSVKNEPLHVALDKIFLNTDIDFQVVDGKIVLKKSPNKPKSNSFRKKSFEPTPATTMVETASIDPQTLFPAFSTEELHTVPVVDESTFAPEELVPYFDTTIYMAQQYVKQKKQILKRYIAKMDSLGKIGDVGSMKELKKRFASSMKKLKAKVNAASDSLKVKTLPAFRDKNDTAQIKTPVQLSLFYPIGTNGAMSGRATNNVSINIWIGYAYALDGVEFAGWVNTEKSYVKGAQFAGIGNLNGGNVTGVQFAGWVNAARGTVDGGRFAGIVNVNGGDAIGAQFAGIINVTGGMANGVRFAGIANFSGDSAIGFQAAGITNVTNGSFVGAQLAGIANVHNGSSAGFMAAGITNVSEGPTRGVRIAGIANVSGEEHNGLQLAGIVNRAKRVRGSQIGLINIADTVTGITLGLVNIVKNGYNKFEVYSSEALTANVAFRYGARKFHTILTVGAQPAKSEKDFRLGFGAGFGTFLPVTNRSGFTVDLMATHINEGYNEYTSVLNLLNQLKISYEFKLANHFRVFAGPTFNVMVSGYKDQVRNRTGSSIRPNSFFDNTYATDREMPINVQMWVGFNAGLRF